MRRAILTVAILACVLGLSACGDDKAGVSGSKPDSKTSSKIGAGGTTSAPNKGGSSKTGSSKTGSGKTGTPLAGTDPCTLLKRGDVPELDKVDPNTGQDPDPEPQADAGGHPSCATHYFAVAIIDNDQLSHEIEAEGSLAQPVPDIAGHHATRARMQVGAGNSCLVYMDVTTDEYVRVGVTSPDNDMDKACDLVMRAATVVASRISA
ncbi:MAG: DUF3558 domain-containing protein [Catenulispora sp.]|nr:DUF3558 domain-containing protein [Catenulispora sp.]